jgi:hypothetical protein
MGSPSTADPSFEEEIERWPVGVSNSFDERWIDGTSADLDYPAYGSPWLRAFFGANRIEVNAGGDQPTLVLDFSENVS